MRMGAVHDRVWLLRSRIYEIISHGPRFPLPHGSVLTNFNSGRRGRRGVPLAPFEYYEAVNEGLNPVIYGHVVESGL